MATKLYGGGRGGGKSRRAVTVAQKIEFQRADPKALESFDQNTKVCTMNCGPHRDDPRTDKERKYLCDDCLTKET